MTSAEILYLLPPSMRDYDIYGDWEWLAYPEKILAPQRYVISHTGVVFDLVRGSALKVSKAGEQRILTVKVYTYLEEITGLSLAKALLYTFVGGPPSGRATHKVVYVDYNRENVILSNVRWR